MKNRVLLSVCVGLFSILIGSGPASGGDKRIELNQKTATSGGGSQAYGFPAINADGSRIVFQSNRDLTPDDPGNPDGDQERFQQLFLWDAKTGFRQITSTVQHFNINSMISGDGATVAFQSTADLTPNNPGHLEPNFEVYTWQEDTGFRQITNFGNGYLSQVRGISADGTSLAILAGRTADPNNPNQIYHWREGQGLTQITSGPFTYYVGGMTADGQVMVLVSDADLTPNNPGNPNGVLQIFTWTEGVGFRQITSSLTREVVNERPAISPDGAWIAFRSTDDLAPGKPGNPDGNAEVFLWRDGEGFTQLTAAARPYGSDNPVVTDAGTVAFLSSADLTPDRLGNPQHDIQLFVWRKGSGITQITATNGARNFARAISNDGTRIPLVSNGDLTGENPDQQAQLFEATIIRPKE